MFSPILPTSSVRSSSSDATASGPSFSTASSTRSANARNSSFFETGSVSEPIATIVPFESSMRASTMPSVVSWPARLPAWAMPALAQELLRGLEVAVGVLERALRVHHRRAGHLAQRP